MGFGLCFGSIGIGKCDGSEPTSTTFTNNETLVNNFFEEISQKFDITMQSDATVQNTAQIGERVIVADVGKNSKVNVKTNIDQKAEAELVQKLNALINEILESNESSDVKLDALATISQNSESSKLLKEASGNVSVNNSTRIENITSTVKQLQTFLNVLSSATVRNEIKIDKLNLKVSTEQGAEFNMVDNIKQVASYYNEQLIDLVNSSETCKETGLTQELVAEIEAEQKVQETGLIESATKGFSSIITSWMLPAILVVVAIIVLIIMVNLVKVFKVKRETSLVNGGYLEDIEILDL